jgi:predicted amidohydrolase YtcJ
MLDQIIDIQSFDVKSIEDVVQVLTNLAGKGPVVVKGYDPHALSKPGLLGIVQLDAISKKEPILVIHKAGQTAYANTAAFDKVHVTESSRPVGGTYGHDAEGKLNGLIYEVPAILTVLGGFADLIDFDYTSIAKKSVQNYAKQGFTTVTDMGLGVPLPTPTNQIDVLRDLANREDAPVRIQGYVVFSLLNQLKELNKQNTDRFRLNGIKIWADGSILGYTAALKNPYKGEKTLGKINFTQEALVRMVLEATKLGEQVAIHASGDQAISDAILAFENAQNDRPNRDPRFRIEQASLADQALLKRMVKVQATPVFTNLLLYFWGSQLQNRFLGEERAKHLDMTKTALDLGLKFSFSDNAPLTSTNPLLMIQQGVTRQVLHDGVLNPDQAISVNEAIKAVTIYPAWQSFRESDLGSIEVGKIADFVILDQNPKTIEPRKIGTIKVLKTYLDGKPVILN